MIDLSALAVAVLTAGSVCAAEPPPTGPAHVHDMSGMEGMDMSAHAGHAMMTGMEGPYPMTRDASGTAWGPDSAPHEGVHGAYGGWATMLHGYATTIYDDQGGGRGATMSLVQSHFMGMAQRAVGADTLTLKGAISFDPFMGKRGYPLLLQTGETADGRTHLIDRQHPHNFFSELSATYAHPVAAGTAVFAYLGYPGEPALGPVTYLHRFAGQANPETPIDHHWLDSTHITFGVATLGLTHGPFKLEVSDFTGREPDQHRWRFNRARFDSWSTRLTVNPALNWSMQASFGDIHSPEQLTPEMNQTRTTASITYNRPLTDGNVQSTLAWGETRNTPGHRLNAYLAEAALTRRANTVFGRAEAAEKDELFPEGSPLDGHVFNVGKLSLGYFHTLPVGAHLSLDLGGLVSKYALPSALKPTYGADPTSFMLFARVRLR
jgi:nitrous oxide reductase accessory protein NosL